MNDLRPSPMTLEEAKQILKMEFDWDWEKFRREAAKEMLPLTATFKITKGDTLIAAIPMKAAVKMAIEYADELIKQLREEKK